MTLDSEGLETVARALVEKMDALDDYLSSFFVTAYAKGLVWRGDNWKAELDELRAYLATLKQKEGEK